jgi:hypothetical protein
MMKDNDETWTLPQRKPITKEVLDRATEAEEKAAFREHHAREAWFDRQHGTVMLKLTDGRVFGAEHDFIPSLREAVPEQLSELRASEDGMFLIMEESPLAIRRSGARLAGLTTSVAKAVASARNGRLGGRPKSKVRQHG